MRKMQGGGTVRTWDIPADAERLSYYIRTNGRPLKAMVELVRDFCCYLLLFVVCFGCSHLGDTVPFCSTLIHSFFFLNTI